MAVLVKPVFWRYAGFEKLQPRGEGLIGRAASATDEGEGGSAPSQAAGVPAEDGVSLASVKAPPQRLRQLQACRARRGRGGPAQHCARPVEFGVNVRTEVERKAHVVAAAADLVDDARRCARPGPAGRSDGAGPAGQAKGSRRAPRSTRPRRRCPGRRFPWRSRAAARGRGRPRWTGSDRRALRCYERSWNGSTNATRARRDSNTCPDRRGHRRRRSGPPRTARRHGRARRC